MKYLIVILVILNADTCQNSKTNKHKVKKIVSRHYSARTVPITYEIKKNELEFAFETGHDLQGNQTYSINYLTDPKDTTWYKRKNFEKKVGNKICSYQDSTLIVCRIDKKDTVRLFYPPDFDKPTAYELYDEKGIIGGIYPYDHKKYPFKKTFVSERRFDKRGTLIYYVTTDYYLPEDFDPEKNQVEKTLKKNLLQAGKGKIVEMEYEYYD